MPPAEVMVDENLVRRLLRDQHPDLAGRQLVHEANGWDNVLFRLGEDLSVRLPRRAAAAVLIEHEQRWVPSLARALPVPVPVPVRSGRPALGYPWPWSVCRWLPGAISAGRPLADPAEEARRLGAFLAAMHHPAPADAPVNPVRGRPLAGRAFAVDERIRQLGATIDREAVERRWEELVQAPPWREGPVWIHGDLHPANVLVDAGAISGVIDFGDLAAGDPAVDLAVAWMLFDRRDHEPFRVAAGDVDQDTWTRGRGWALHLALAFLANSADNPVMAGIGRRTLAAVLGD
jgi:aminoglycoside phosphotransferase (APT) family kinase protein